MRIHGPHRAAPLQSPVKTPPGRTPHQHGVQTQSQMTIGTASWDDPHSGGQLAPPSPPRTGKYTQSAGFCVALSWAVVSEAVRSTAQGKTPHDG